MMRSLLLISIAAVLGATSPTRAATDYPTTALADYVFGCMKANGETEPMLERCSCSIDVIATLLPYDRYVSAETFMRMGMVAGETGALFRSSEQSKKSIGDLKRAQAEAEIRCFE